MKLFLYYIKGIPKIEDYLDRKLIARLASFEEDNLSVKLSIESEEPVQFRNLLPGKNYAVEFEHESGEREFKYYTLDSFELELKRKRETPYVYYITLYVTPI